MVISMLEIPESSTIARQMNETVQGKVIRFANANKSPHKFAWYFGDPNDYNNLLEGKKIGTSFARGGMVEIEAEDCRIVIGDGAALRFYDDLGKVPEKNQLYIEFTDGSALAATIQMYGGIWAFKEGQNDNPYYLGSCEKPSPLSCEFSYEYFRSLYNESLQKKSVKAFLATEQRIPGIGNGVIQDMLFQAGLHPKRKMSTLTEEDMRNLYQTVKKVLNEMIEGGDRDTEKDLFGNTGRYMTYMSKKTYGEPCTKCGYLIHKESFLGGTVYFCEHCQREE
ncbi:endonuclease VIII [Anaerocolumna xylanovorans]|uniref:Formamidopyrimidine-DNA glycosylase n=1 Tax=Anaerocolumna xylanovorans DSM 12503 TaxID=1121345 RepID=A0A1M7YH46_9FIRM|nr:endonuclease VIII [Anaerocolumna xylanovorans]SHO51940.1 formamidopyrimidine-DNA glycosylase [Anaerocolumna xylanovorans DSM 12503]